MSNNRGSALFVALLFMMVIGAAAAASWQALHFEHAGAREQRQSEEAYYIAEAGIEKAIAMLRQFPSYHGEQNTPFASGYFDLAVTSIAFLPTYKIRAIGRLQDGPAPRESVTLEATLQLDVAGKVLQYTLTRAKSDS